jgi:hypothetical protein
MKPKTTIEFVAGPDKEGKYIFFLDWVNSEGKKKGQIFRTDPRTHGHEIPTDPREIDRLKYNMSRW